MQTAYEELMKFKQFSWEKQTQVLNDEAKNMNSEDFLSDRLKLRIQSKKVSVIHFSELLERLHV